ncbi:MocR-like pyridoxine biosynthesis transcription factor PdxR [Nocardiopsis ganjiahuensis]|uniref:MocR-like pyridoxine biosynthesis transcription factor PdxR n=1 Tax=Nocardiopsis ganjiahuensis TaxID=239984 RepID=UPI0004755359|nr:PLP-dependent aminotransferase family protein [Nocardiopsis ganjiahuensis]
MRQTRANSDAPSRYPGIDLHLEAAGTRVSRSLESALREAVVDGRLPSGTRLPASRTLAADLGISRNSVAEAYTQLTAEGWLDARVGAGTWVADRPGRSTPAAPPAGTPAPVLDLRGGIPDSSVFPHAEWTATMRRALAAAPSDAFGYPDPRGAPPLREALAGYLARVRGVRARADDVVVGAGFGDLLARLCRALRESGVQRIAVEEFGHRRHREIIRDQGLETVPLPVDAGGADVGLLGSSGARAVLLTPAHQFPTGVALSPERRLSLVRWAGESGGLVLEDDYDGEFRYDRRAVGALQALAPEHVVHLGTASKSLAPAVGLAWAVAPGRLVPALVRAGELSGGGQDTLGQLALAAFLTSHRYDRNVRRLREHYRSRRREVVEEVAARLPGCRVSGLAAGLHCLLELPEGVHEEDVCAEAAGHGLALEGLSAFRAEGTGPDGGRTAVVLGYGAPRPHLFRAALAAAVDSAAACAP